MPGKHTLGKSERLKSRKAIDAIFSEGKKFVSGPFRVSWLAVPSDSRASGIQFGVGVSSRNFRRAVDRNRIKRLTREAYRLQKPPTLEKLQGANRTIRLFIIYNGKEIPTFELVHSSMATLLKKLEKLVVV